MLSPWVIGYDRRIAFANSVFVGAAVIFFAMSNLVSGDEL